MSRVVTTALRNLPDLSKTGATFMAVLVKSDAGDRYSAFCGLVHLPTRVNSVVYDRARAKVAKRVAASGLPIEYAECIKYFPAVKKSQYSLGADHV